jgi:hypothetical protein
MAFPGGIADQSSSSQLVLIERTWSRLLNFSSSGKLKLASRICSKAAGAPEFPDLGYSSRHLESLHLEVHWAQLKKESGGGI